MTEVFLSYRGDDAYAVAGIRSSLAARFGSDRLFRDADSMIPGTAYPQAIRAALARCDILVAVIGPRWLSATDGGGRRLVDRPHDWVRLEIAEALRRGIPLVPVLLDGAALPEAAELPPDVLGLTRRQATWVRQRNLDEDTDRLADALSALVPGLERLPAVPTGGPRHVQNNFASRGGTVYASQRNMTVHDRPGRGAR